MVGLRLWPIAVAGRLWIDRCAGAWITRPASSREQVIDQMAQIECRRETVTIEVTALAGALRILNVRFSHE